MLRLRTFGGLSLAAPHRDLSGAAGQRRPLALLAILGVADERGVSRERLQLLLWPESDTERARRVLAQTLYALRRDLGDPAVIQGTTELRLNPALITADVTAFESALSGGQLERAAVLYEGPFLDGVHLDGAAEFERWAEVERERLARRAHDALTRLARAAAQAGDHELAVGFWRRLAALDPLSGQIAVGLMEALAAAGDPAGALRQARIHEALLREELGAPPDPGVATVVERLRTPGRGVTPVPSPTDPRAAPPIRSGQQRPEVAHAAPARPSAPTNVRAGESPAVTGAAREPEVERGADSPPRGAGGSDGAPAAGQPSVEPKTRRRNPRRTRAIAGALALVLIAIAAWATRSRNGDRLDASLVAVAPFMVLDPAVELWRQGVVDVLSRNLDGAGPLRAVPPTVVLRHWGDRVPDRATAVELGRLTGAGLVLFGSFVPSGSDSVRASVTIVDAASGDVLGEVTRSNAHERMDRLTDSLTLGVLRELGAHRPVGAVRNAGLGAGTSLEALKAFLRGEQFLRQARWDSARSAYERAVAHDPRFALAWRGIGNTIAWQHLVTDTLSGTALLQAGALNHGLGLRDSLLVAADSLAAAANAAPTTVAEWPFKRRLFATLDEAVRRYPNDPEAWYMLGEARYHFGFGPVVGVPDEMTLRAFDRVITLDSTFAPAYLHAIELALTSGGPAVARRYIRSYQALGPTEDAHRSVELVRRLIDPALARSTETVRLLDTLPADVLLSAYTVLRRWPDSAETALRVARRFAAGDRPSRNPRYEDERFRRRILAEQLAYRGHVREAWRLAADLDAGVVVVLPYLEAMPTDTAAALLASRFAAGSPWIRHALRWWATAGDSGSLQRFLESRRAMAGATEDPLVASGARYDTAAAHAYLSLVRGDSTAALERFVALPDSLCPNCALDRLTEGELLAAHGRHREALATLSEPPLAYLTPVELMLAVARARVVAQLQACDAARQAYGLVARAWANADPELQPLASDARRAVEQWRPDGGGCFPRAGDPP